MNTNEIITVVSTAVILVLASIGIIRSTGDDNSATAEPDSVKQWLIQKGDIEYQMAVEIADQLLKDKYQSSPFVYRPRNFLVTFVASRPDLLGVTASYWLETVETGLVQKCEGQITIRRGNEPEIEPPGLWDYKCE